MSKCNSRRLKVYYGHHGNYRRHPVIRLGGNYLEKMNFKVGDFIDIYIEENKIVIVRQEINTKA